MRVLLHQLHLPERLPGDDVLALRQRLQRRIRIAPRGRRVLRQGGGDLIQADRGGKHYEVSYGWFGNETTISIKVSWPNE